jgi:hypothetical protein
MVWIRADPGFERWILQCAGCLEYVRSDVAGVG